jgi:hypothetical protein
MTKLVGGNRMWLGEIRWVNRVVWCNDILWYSKTCLKQNLKGPEHFFAEARFPFNQAILW